MSSIPSIISPVLKEAVELKIEEFAQTTADFKRRYDENSTVIATESDTLKRLAALLEQIKTFDRYLEDGHDLDTMTRYVEQAKNDRSISQAKLQKFEKRLLDKLESHYHRLDVSALHISMLREALNSSNSISSVTGLVDRPFVQTDEDFDVVEGDLEAAFERFEKSTSTAKEIDVEKLETYLLSVFENDVAKMALDGVRQRIQYYGHSFIKGTKGIQEHLVGYAINDLLQNSLLSDKRRITLQSYSQSPSSIRELTSLLNVKSVRTWNWRNPEKGLPVTARQNAEGKYCITVEEDVVDQLFLHCLALGWSMKVKELLGDDIHNDAVWSRNQVLSAEETAKRDYYLLPSRCHEPPPPPSCPAHYSRKPKKRSMEYENTMKTPIDDMSGSLSEERFTNYYQTFFLSRLPKSFGSAAEVNPVNRTQAELMKQLATEARLREAFDGEAQGLSANFRSFASSLPHKTILTLLKFIGVPNIWLEFFTRFLEAPLDMGPVVRGTSDQVLKRVSGVPVGHGFELLFGELLLYFLDLSVHQKTGGYLYRLRDKSYFVGKSEQCKLAHDSIVEFSAVAGLDVSIANCLSWDPIGFVNFGIQQGRPLVFTIVNSKVESYAHRVKKQLAACTSMIDWIRLWNTTMGRYASHLFGPLANVFGKAHLESVTEAYNSMFTIIFGSSNLTVHLTQLLATHVDPKSSITMEPLIYVPTLFGGLGVKNPYTTLNLARELYTDPCAKLTTFLSEEQSYYAKAGEVFASFPEDVREDKRLLLSPLEQASLTVLFTTRDPAAFMTLEEYTANREIIRYPNLAPKHYSDNSRYTPYPPDVEVIHCPPSILNIYTSLLEEPRYHIVRSVRVDNEVMWTLSRRFGRGVWDALDGEENWVLQMYADECFEQYGGFKLWCEESVPTEVLKMLRGEEGDDREDSRSNGSCDD
ncbi:hypothetical protein K504DRAFT_448123 [Pleomassaria siparia CBS 279.74]|uniref:Uncharacterized protein n=1 Tax=Pleomassaria siparia CBS 279.74 TaxID=1314801 RepID=A0A6G1K0Q3_9PLEO|nr:hypothetical protein K504DRAFT_448123 [Pleomassaria siparia CBS 279.74]